MTSVPHVWMVQNKVFMALFDTEEAALEWLRATGNAVASSGLYPVQVPVFSEGKK